MLAWHRHMRAPGGGNVLDRGVNRMRTPSFVDEVFRLIESGGDEAYSRSHPFARCGQTLLMLCRAGLPGRALPRLATKPRPSRRPYERREVGRLSRACSRASDHNL